MVRTRVGYCGGTTPAPTYRALGDHTEAFQVTYDPAVVTYEELLEVFFSEHDPTDRIGSRQYRNALWYADEDQQRAAAAAVATIEASRGEAVRTAIEPLRGFTPAEDYHQKYRLRRIRPLVTALEEALPGDASLTRSSTAMRLNAYLGGSLTRAEIERDLEALGHPAASVERLLRLAHRMRR